MFQFFQLCFFLVASVIRDHSRYYGNCYDHVLKRKKSPNCRFMLMIFYSNYIIVIGMTVAKIKQIFQHNNNNHNNNRSSNSNDNNNNNNEKKTLWKTLFYTILQRKDMCACIQLSTNLFLIVVVCTVMVCLASAISSDDILFCFGYLYISSNDSRLIYIYVEAFIVHSCCVCLCICATVCHQIIAQDIDHWQANNLEDKDRLKTKKYTMLCGVCMSCL